MTLRWCETCWEPQDADDFDAHWHTNEIGVKWGAPWWPPYTYQEIYAPVPTYADHLAACTKSITQLFEMAMRMVDDESHIIRSEN